ncbi:hypothetical protein [Streptomyces sp. NPDC001380]|uniref:hypothetical protein n=1 Tax=Streptomyces sp. NPDC001380 TaxID=3364566 RepID=UPI003688AE72
MDEDRSLTCAELHDAAAELALGVLPARERAAAVQHLDRCPGCRGEVHRLTLAGDALLDLVPGSEPPVGFEDRVLVRLGTVLRPVRQRHRRRRSALLAAAAAALLAVGAGGWALGSSSGPPAAAEPAVSTVGTGHTLRSAALQTGDGRLGDVFAYGGDSPWLYVSVDAEQVGSSAGGMVQCVLQRSDGSRTSLGTFPLRDGYGAWGEPYPAGAPVSGVRLVTSGGRVLAAAVFDPPAR